MSTRAIACFLLTSLLGCTREPEIIIVPVSSSTGAAQTVEVEEVEEAEVVVESLHPGALRDRIMEVGGRTPTRTLSGTPQPSEEAVSPQHPLAEREPTSRRIGENPTRRKNQHLK